MMGTSKEDLRLHNVATLETPGLNLPYSPNNPNNPNNPIYQNTTTDLYRKALKSVQRLDLSKLLEPDQTNTDIYTNTKPVGSENNSEGDDDDDTGVVKMEIDHPNDSEGANNSGNDDDDEEPDPITPEEFQKLLAHLPFIEGANPLLALVQFLAATISPVVASSAAKAILKALGKHSYGVVGLLGLIGSLGLVG